MKIRHQMIPLSKAEPGMILAADILDRRNHLLLPCGRELTEVAISNLEKRQISSIVIQWEDHRDDAELAAERENIHQQIDQLFANTEEQTELQKLKQLILDYRLEQHS